MCDIEKSPTAALAGSSEKVSRENRIAIQTSPNMSGSETNLREEAFSGNPSKKKAFLEAQQHLIAEIDHYQRDIKSHVDEIAKLSGRHQSTGNTCRLLSDSNLKLGQRISELLAQQQAPISLISSKDVQGEINGKLSSEEPTSDERRQIAESDKVLTLSDMTMARGARFNQGEPKLLFYQFRKASLTNAISCCVI